MNKTVFKLLILTSAICLSACGNVRESLGITKDAPDEFSVVRHAPLEMPTSMALPPPRPGQPRPQEQAPTAQAKNVIFGNGSASSASVGEEHASGAESALLQKSGATQSDPNIRSTLDTESIEYEEKNKPVVKRLLGLGGVKTQNTAETLDPKIESERLKKKNLPTTELPPEWNKKEATKK